MGQSALASSTKNEDKQIHHEDFYSKTAESHTRHDKNTSLSDSEIYSNSD